MFYFLHLLLKAILVDEKIIARDTSVVGLCQGILSLLAASACGKMRLVTMVKKQVKSTGERLKTTERVECGGTCP